MLLSFAAGIQAESTLTTTHLPDSSLTFSVDGSSLTVSGAILCDRLEKIMVSAGEEERFLTAGSGKQICETFTLSGTDPVSVRVYTKKAGEELYWSYIWQTVSVTYTDAGYRLVTAPVYANNTAVLESWINPADHLSTETDPAVAAKAAEILGGETDPYRKLLALYRWTAENLYYDNDYTAGRTQTTPLAPADVLAAGHTVCEGYVNLLRAFCQSQGIPCMAVSGYGAGTGTDGFISAEDSVLLTESNHTHAAAWVNGRWIHMDPTWDSPNRYENGVKNRGISSGYMYFDTTLDYLSMNHKILTVPAAAAENTPSTWAVPEVRAALEADIVPYPLQKKYTAAISRADFCQLLMTMLVKRMGYTSLDALTADRGLTFPEPVFSDTQELSNRQAIEAANALGIVNGRGNGIFDPASGITRQEAAAMLMRAAKVLDIPMGGSPRSFADMTEADEWAAIGILYVSSLQNPAGQAVMGGTGETTFSPKNTYTTEQAILTMIRLMTVSS